MNVMFIGARAAGKTTLARIIGLALSRQVVDMDELALAQFEEESVAQVWHSHGERAWREAEARVIDEVLKGEDQVIALGGGAPLVPAVEAAIQAAQQDGRVKVIYLFCSPGELKRRLAEQPGDRPSLAGRDSADEIELVLSQRDPVYRALANAVVDVSRLGERDAADVLIRAHF